MLSTKLRRSKINYGFFFSESYRKKNVVYTKPISSMVPYRKKEADITTVVGLRKLSEKELYQELAKVTELPEVKLDRQLSNQIFDAKFIHELTKSVPLLLTTSLVNISKILYKHSNSLSLNQNKNIQKLWRILEVGIIEKISNLTNEQVIDVLTSFGLSSQGTKKLYLEFEEVVIRSELPFTMPQMEKILTVYTQLDIGSPHLYEDFAKTFIKHKDEIGVVKFAELCYMLSRTKNIMKGAFDMYKECEKLVRVKINSNGLTFSEISKVAELLFERNIGSNKIQDEIEEYIFNKFDEKDVGACLKILKSLANYYVKNPVLEDKLLQFTDTNLEGFNIQQLEDVIWAYSRKQRNVDKILPKIVDLFLDRYESPKARNLAFTIESFSRMFNNKDISEKEKQLFKKLEQHLVEKIDEFNPHYLVKAFVSLYKVKQESGEVYELLINKIIANAHSLKYLDILSFMDVFPKFSYIYENNMDIDLWVTFEKKLLHLVIAKMPMDDICRLVTIVEKVGFATQEFMSSLLLRIKESVFDIPKEHFANTIYSLVSLGSGDLAEHMVSLINTILAAEKFDSYFDQEDRIKIIWALTGIEKAEPILNKINYKFINEMEINKMDAQFIKLFTQTLFMIQSAIDNIEKAVDFNKLFKQFESISQEMSAELIGSDPLTLNSQDQRILIEEELKKDLDDHPSVEVLKNFTDNFYNLLDIAVYFGQTKECLGIVLANKWLYFSILDSKTHTPINRFMLRFYLIKHDIMINNLGWGIKVIDTQDIAKQKETEEEKNKALLEKIKSVKEDINAKLEEHKKLKRDYKRARSTKAKELLKNTSINAN